MYQVPPISGGKRKPPKTPSPPNVMRGEEPLTEPEDDLLDTASFDSTKTWGDTEFSSDIGSPSTNSEPFYLRTPGFEHHGHVFSVTPKCKPLASLESSKTKSEYDVRLCSNIEGKDEISKTEIKLPADSCELLKTTLTEKSSSASKVLCKKKKGNDSAKKIICVNDMGCLKDPSAPKLKPRREPLPMKLRALPLSFWQQPNQASEFSPAQCAVPLLPPLFKSDSNNEVTEIRPITPERKPDGSITAEGSASSSRSFDGSGSKLSSTSSRIIKISNTDLLMKLFDGLEEQKPSIIRRGRPKKETAVFNRKTVRGEDPCFGSTASDGILPFLGNSENRASSLVGATGSSGVGGFKSNNLTSISVNSHGSQTVTILSLKDGDNNVVSLPALSLENNYSQMLSELVVKL